MRHRCFVMRSSSPFHGMRSWAPAAAILLAAVASGTCSRDLHTGAAVGGVDSGQGGTVGSGSGGASGAGSGGRGTGGGTSGTGGTPAGQGGSTGGQAGSTGTGATGGGGGPQLDGSPLYTRVQRLTKQQWQSAVTDILRLDSPAPELQAAAKSPLGVADFSNNEKLLVVDLDAELDFEPASEAAAARATGSADALARLYAGTDSLGFVRALGRRAFRRPLTADEETSYQGMFAMGESLYGAGFANGAALVIRAMLASPKFLYRSELGAAGAPLSGYEVAAKLSFWLLGTTPSDDLLDKAASGALDSADGVESAARAMLEQPAATAMMRDFHAQMYHLDRYDALDPARADAGLRSELTEASSRFFDAIFSGGESLRSIFTSTRFFAGPGLAPLYGLTPAPTQLEERMSDASRGGYFTQVPFLLLNGAPDGESDPIARGVALSGDVLCVPSQPHATPPPAVPALVAGQTNRSRIEALTAGCGDCHTSMIDPLGFALEGFDGLGRTRSSDNGAPVDTRGAYPFSDGARTFADAGALMALLADSADVQRCYAKHLASYALQRDVVEGDRATIDSLAVAARDHSLKEVIVSLVRDPAFRLRAEEGP